MTTAAASGWEMLEARVAPLREQLGRHPLYAHLRTLAHVRTFMESHVFAVWDFMTLLKSLQRTLTCVDLPWVPTRFPASRRFINEIVLGEESDQFQGRPVSHFEVYLEAMQAVGADTAAIRTITANTSRRLGEVDLALAPAAARAFVATTFAIVQERSPAAQAAAFAIGREDTIPEMFRALIRGLNQELDGRLSHFIWYLERHIEVDGDDHGPLAIGMVTDLCGDDGALWEEAAVTAEIALRARIRLWDGILEQLRQA